MKAKTTTGSALLDRLTQASVPSAKINAVLGKARRTLSAAPAQREYKATAPVQVEATPPRDVERSHVVLSSITWRAIDHQRRDTGLTAEQFITQLVQKSGKA